jgi:hypothetical protein
MHQNLLPADETTVDSDHLINHVSNSQICMTEGYERQKDHFWLIRLKYFEVPERPD